MIPEPLHHDDACRACGELAAAAHEAVRALELLGVSPLEIMLVVFTADGGVHAHGATDPDVPAAALFHKQMVASLRLAASTVRRAGERN